MAKLFSFRKPTIRISKKGKIGFSPGSMRVGGRNAGVNFSKKGMSASGGVRGARYSSRTGTTLGCPLTALVLVALVAVLAACSAVLTSPAATPEALTAQGVVDKFIAAGLEISDIEQLERPEGMPELYQFKERWGFTIAEVAPRGGQVYMCEVRPHCDLLMEFFKAFEDLGGKYYYLVPGGLAVVQLNNEVSPETAAKFEAAVAGLK